jgi:hypothetical protein
MARDVRRRAETLRDVAASFSASYDSFWRAVQNGSIKVIRIGKRMMVPLEEIERIEREGLSLKPKMQR